jgi:hypothetical protein
MNSMHACATGDLAGRFHDRPGFDFTPASALIAASAVTKS